MAKYVATKLHKAMELAPEDEFLARCAAAPHYVIDDSLLALLQRSDIKTSVTAMLEAGICRLPFAEMIIELELQAIRAFVLLNEFQDAFRAQLGVLHSSGAAFEVGPQLDVRPTEAGFSISAEKPTHTAHARIAALACGIALLMLNVGGVEKEVLEVSRLNKHREQNGTPGIPRHTVVRIGHVYDARGQAHRVGGETGRTMPIHLRAGHARRQHFGEGNAETKVIYVPPCLINFHPGAEVRLPKKIIAA